MDGQYLGWNSQQDGVNEERFHLGGLTLRCEEGGKNGVLATNPEKP